VARDSISNIERSCVLEKLKVYIEGYSSNERIVHERPVRIADAADDSI
jgi:hypothetical protein